MKMLFSSAGVSMLGLALNRCPAIASRLLEEAVIHLPCTALLHKLTKFNEMVIGLC